MTRCRSFVRLAVLPALGSFVLSQASFAQASQRATPNVGLLSNVDSGLFKGLRYRMIGPDRGGRVTAVTGVPSEPHTFYMGVDRRRRVEDHRRRRRPGCRSPTARFAVGSIGVDRRVADPIPNIVYVGTGSDGIRSNVSIGRGVYKSTDAGADVDASSDCATRDRSARCASTRPNPEHRLRRRDRQSVHAQRRARRLSARATAASHLAEGALPLRQHRRGRTSSSSPATRTSCYAVDVARRAQAVDDHQRRARGRHLQEHRRRRPLDEAHERAAQRARRQEQHRRDGREPEPRLRARSRRSPAAASIAPTTRASTWTLVNSSTPRIITRPFYYTTLAADPTNADVVYAGAEGFFKSTDGGKTFRTMRTPHGDNHDMWINPRNGERHDPVERRRRERLAQRRPHAGARSTTSRRPRSTRSTSDNQFPYRLYGAQQDNTTLIVPSACRSARGPDDPIRAGARARAARRARSCRTRRTPTPSTARARDSSAA